MTAHLRRFLSRPALLLLPALLVLPPAARGEEAKGEPAAPPPPKAISKGPAALTYQAFPDVCRLQNGDIVAVFYAGYGHVSLPTPEVPNGGRICLVRSSDEGRTWTEPAVIFDDEHDNRDPHVSQLADGTLVCTFFTLIKKTPEERSAGGGENWRGAGVQIITSRDNGKTWDAKPLAPFPDWYCSAPVRQLPDGTCVLGLYREDPETKLSVGGTARSSDGGRTWEKPVPIRAPGVSLDAETDVIRLNDGSLYAALRSRPNDLYFAVSTDDGRSWSEARKTGHLGHCPHFTRLKTGEILLGVRLPKTSLLVSRDDAKTWEGPHLVDSCIGAYPATVELKDGSVLIVYYTEGGGSEIRARRFRLKPDGLEFLPL